MPDLLTDDQVGLAPKLLSDADVGLAPAAVPKRSLPGGYVTSMGWVPPPGFYDQAAQPAPAADAGPKLLSDADVGLSGLLTDDQVGFPKPAKATLKGVGNALLQEGTKGIGAAAKGVAALSAISPMYASESGFYPEPVVEATERRIARTPAQIVQDIREAPGYELGTALQEAAPEAHPVPPEQESTFPVRAARMVGGFVPMIASGPMAPVTIGLQSAGEHITADFDQAKAEGLDDDAAATRALDRATASGTLQATLFAALPPAIRAPFEKFLIDKLGAGPVSRWLLGRTAAGSEGAALGATSKAAENVVEGKPVTEDVGPSAAGLAGANLLLPWLRSKEGPPPGQPPAVPESGTAPPTPAKPVVTEDLLKGLQEDFLRNQITRNRVAQAVEELTKPAGQEAETPPPSSQAPVENVAPEPNASEVLAGKAVPEEKTAETPVEALQPISEGQRQQLRELGLDGTDISDLQNGRLSVKQVVDRKLQPFEGGGGPDHAKALEEARLEAWTQIDQVLTGEREPAKVEPGAGAETITGQNERTGSEVPTATSSAVEPMPAEREERPSPRQPSPSLSRDRDILDEVLDVGKINLGKARAIQEDFKPTGVLRKAFTSQGGLGPDEVLDALHRSGLYRGLETEDDLLDALKQAGPNRVATRSQVADEARAARVEGKQLEQFQSKALRGERPKAQQGNVETIRVNDLLEGDTFEVQGHKLTVRNLDIDEDGNLNSLEVKDGPKFGVQRVGPDEVIHIDKGSYEPGPGGTDFLPTERGPRGPTDFDRYQLTAQAREASAKGQAPDAAVLREIEEIKNRNEGMPPEEEPVAGGGAGAPSEPAAKDPILDWLNGAIEATDPNSGQMMEGVTGAPVWATKALANGALRIVREAYQLGKKLADAIDMAVVWLRKQTDEEGRTDFDPEDARRWVTDLVRNANPVVERQPAAEPNAAAAAAPGYGALMDRLRAVTERLNEINKQASRPGGLTQELRGERYQLAREGLAIRRELATNPEYVADLLRKMDAAGKELEQARKAGNGLHVREAGETFQDLAEQLTQVKPELMHRIYNDLVRAGEIAGSKAGEVPSGRTMAELIRWLQQNKLDSPKLSLRERFNFAQRLADAWSHAKDMAGKAADRVAAMWEAFKDQYHRPPSDNDFRSLLKDWFFTKQWTGLETHRWVQEIRRQIPSRTRRWALSVWMDAEGNQDVLRSQADLVPARFKPVWEAALKLTPKEQALGRRIQLDFEQKLEDGQNAGLIDRGRAHYGVPQRWDVLPKHEGEYDPFEKKGTPRNPTAKLDPRDPFFALKRTHPTYFDGIMAGGVPESLDIGDLVGLYNADFHNALADRGFIKALKDAKAPDGSPGVMIAGGARIEPRAEGERTYFVDSNWRPKDAVTRDGRPYRSIDHWALKDWKFASQTETGNPIIVHGDFLVHPDFYRFLKNELGRSALRDPEGTLGGLAHVTNAMLSSTAFLKASKFASATFHMATIGEHAMFHGVLPITRGVELDPARNLKLAGLIRHGMDLGFGAQRELFEEGLSSHGGLWGHVPGLGDAMTRLSEFLFKDYIPKIKAKIGLVVLDRNLARYQGKLSTDQISELTARQVNAAFGIQNWRLMGSNRTMLDVNRLLLTAPDFLLSRAKVVAQALKPYNREQRYFLLAQAAVVYVAARALNQILDGDPHWEAQNALSVVYNGRAYTARFLVNDIWHMVEEPMSFAQGRIGPGPRTLIDALYQRDMRTGNRIGVPFETNSKVWRAAQIVVQDMASWLVPAGFEGFMPGAKGREQTGPGQAAAALVGVGSHRYTPETQMFDLAQDFNRSGDAQAQLYQRQRDAEARGESAYRKLSALLDAGSVDQARDEYEALLEQGQKADSIARHYAQVSQPFTGNRAREELFRQSLSPGQLAIYLRALDERRQRWERFQEMLRLVPPR